MSLHQSVRSEVSEARREVEGLKLENEVLQKFLDRAVQEPQLNDEKTDSKRVSHSTKRIRDLFTSQVRQRRRNVPPTLTIEQKCEIANSEYELMQQELSEDKKRAERIANTLRAVLEETDIRITELKKDAYEFKRDIVVGGENMRTGKTMAEKMTRYMEEKLRQRDSLIEKLRLKNATIKAQMNKVEVHLRQKEEMGDVLHYIDFHQLQIENKQYLSKIEQRNDELLRLKTTTGKTVHTLNVVKQKLLDSIRDSNWLKTEISSRTAQLRAVQREVNKTAADIRREQKAHCRLDRQQTEATDMPTTLDYVQQKAQKNSLNDMRKNWERKVEIAEIAAKRATAPTH